jgi:hypothetical protein
VIRFRNVWLTRHSGGFGVRIGVSYARDFALENSNSVS